jgi:hypothetical protein
MIHVQPESTTPFIVGQNAPKATEMQLPEAFVANNLGTIALSDVRLNLSDLQSVVYFDDTVCPPVLRLDRALSTVTFGETDPNTHRFVADETKRALTHVVSGIYLGTGSTLELSIFPLQ